ncbi:MAG: hypothetical protein WCV85_02835 [Patescibacteria group bacterium]|jgi:hypothetical protein
MCLFKRVYVNGQQATVAQDGFFETDLRGPLDISVAVLPTAAQAARSFAFSITGREKVITLRDWVVEDEVVSVEFTVKLNAQGVPAYPDNHIKVFAIGSDGDFSVYEISVVRQEDRFFLCQQVTHRGTCYRDQEGLVRCPYFSQGIHQWTALMPYIENLAKKFVKVLPPISAYHEPRELLISPKNGHGYVCWFNIAMGVGVAKVRLDGEVQSVKIYWRHITNRTNNGLRYVPESSVITYQHIQLVPNPKGLSHQLIGVKLAA